MEIGPVVFHHQNRLPSCHGELLTSIALAIVLARGVDQVLPEEDHLAAGNDCGRSHLTAVRRRVNAMEALRIP